MQQAAADFWQTGVLLSSCQHQGTPAPSAPLCCDVEQKEAGLSALADKQTGLMLLLFFLLRLCISPPSFHVTSVCRPVSLPFSLSLTPLFLIVLPLYIVTHSFSPSVSVPSISSSGPPAIFACLYWDPVIGSGTVSSCSVTQLVRPHKHVLYRVTETLPCLYCL